MGAARVVVVGGGYCGARAARALDADARLAVTLVDEREAQLHKIAALRAVADSRWAPATQVPRDRLLRRGTVRVGRVAQVEGNVLWLTASSCRSTCLWWPPDRATRVPSSRHQRP